jgi:hypothetical protein
MMIALRGLGSRFVALIAIASAGCLAEPSSGSYGRVRRLSHREYDNVVYDLLGDATQPAKRFIEDAYTNGYDNGSSDLFVQYEQVPLYQSAAETLATAAVAGRMSMLLGGCDVAIRGEAACKRAFYSGFVQRAYRRPPTAAEIARLDAVFDAGRRAGGFALGIQTALEAVLQSPAFLYRTELGDPSKGLDPLTAEYRLTPYELAAELSFLLTGSTPDDTLLSVADSGRLESADDLEREARRLLALPSAKANLRTFVNAWLATDRITSTTKASGPYPAFGVALADSMGSETDMFIDHVLWDGTGSLRELFTSTDSFVDGPLAALYATGTSTKTTKFDAMTLDPMLRRGIMTRGAFLSVHSALDNSGPVARGVFVREALLCAPLPPPPANALDKFNATPPDPHQTTRQRFDQHAQDPRCKGCHDLIDGVGFGFEEFDAIGGFRTVENGQPVDSSGVLQGTDVDGPFNGVSELSERLMSSMSFEQCATTQLFRFAMGRAEDPQDGPTLDSLSSGFSTDARVTDLLLAIARHHAFMFRKPEME